METLSKQGVINSSESECLLQHLQISENLEIASESREAAVPDLSHTQHPSDLTITVTGSVGAFHDSGPLPGKRNAGGLK